MKLKHSIRSSSLVLVLAVAGTACTGQVASPSAMVDTPVAGTSAGGAGVGAGGGTGAGAAAGSGPTSELPAFQAPSGMLRRLTRTQFRNAIRDLLGVEVNTAEVDADSWNGNFAVIGASTVVTSQRGVEQYQTAIESAVDAVFDDATKRAQVMGCTVGTSTDDPCLKGFITETGRRAWRRPLEDAEVEGLLAVARTATSELGSVVEGARWATVSLLASPYFLYRPELGSPRADGSLGLSSYELASRLSFLVWNSLPDASLLGAAESGTLGTTDGLKTTVERLLDAPAGREAVGQFADEYLRLDKVVTQAKDSGLYPEYGAKLQAGMVRDMRETWEQIVLDDRASALSLFSTNKVVVNAELAKVYGLDASGLDGSTFRTLTLPADSQRVGILGKAGFLSQFANQKEGSPTLRGKFIRDALMCKVIPPPPGDVNAMLAEPPADAPLTKRDRLEMHRVNPACAGCHALMDPLGLPLESFDAIGRFRATDRGLPIDPSGELDGKPVADSRAFGLAMSESPAVAECLVRRYYTYAVGHEERDVDARVLAALTTGFQESGFKLRDLIVATVTSEAFSAVAPQQP